MSTYVDKMEIVFIEAGSEDLAMLKAAVDHAVESGSYLRVTMDGDAFKFKTGEGQWSPPVVSHRENGGY